MYPVFKEVLVDCEPVAVTETGEFPVTAEVSLTTVKADVAVVEP